jgi:predicted transcriptional regulator
MTTTHVAELPEPNPSELHLLKILWRDGALAARELHERVGDVQGWAYSTTRTVLERMVGKGLLTKRPFHGLNLYGAAISRPAGLAKLVRDFAERVLELDPAPVVGLFAESEALSAEEIEELAALIERDEAGDAIPKRTEGRR